MLLGLDSLSFLITPPERTEEAKENHRHLEIITFFTLGSRSPDKKTPLVTVNSPVKEIAAALQVVMLSLIHVSVDSVLTKKESIKTMLGVQKNRDKSYSKGYIYHQVASVLGRGNMT